jgi:dipeptidyl aminopeptidase/acylaminoacyl peptidase
MYSEITSTSSFDRSEKNGFRCVFYIDKDRIPENAFQLSTPEVLRDIYMETPVSDEVFDWYKEQFSYDKTDLNARVEMREESSDEWIHEKITFDAAYGNERVITHLFLPKKYAPPYQTVVYFPGGSSQTMKSSENLVDYYEFERFISFFITNGRAVMFPIYKGTFERINGIPVFTQWDTRTYEYVDYLTKLVKDFKRSLDYLEIRQDIDLSKLGYYGYSWGGNMGTIIPSVEDRLKVSILSLGGIRQVYFRPEADPINYVTRIKIPTLMLNGKYDTLSHYENSVKPMFDLLGTPEDHKDLKIYETSHFIPRNELIKESLAWLDKYFGLIRKKQE